MTQTTKGALCASAPFLLIAVIGLFISFATLPGINEPVPRPSNPSHNWMGGDYSVIRIFALWFFAVVYLVKWMLLLCDNKGIAIYLFFITFLLSLPYLWFLVEPAWNNLHVYRISCWVGGPFSFWVIPSLSFAIDLKFKNAHPINFIVRYLIELGVILPIWLYVWFFIELVLGWAYI